MDRCFCGFVAVYDVLVTGAIVHVCDEHLESVIRDATSYMPGGIVTVRAIQSVRAA